MDVTGIHACSHTRVPSFILVMKMRAVDGNKYLTDVPFGSDGGAQNANPKVQGSGLTGSVCGLHREEGALSTALVAETHAFYLQPPWKPPK